ncbi:MAG TPA: hypothetical protein VGR31_13145 [Planctomycetota bacterium]|jgi:hypothetical protein|nr:hypothetical protein [Planctomycetota bacterium]
MGEASDPGGDLLRGGSPKEILARLVDGDPLEVRARCKEQLHLRALLLSLDRLQLRTVARIAYAAPRWRGEPPLGRWLVERIEHSMKELIDEDGEAVLSGIPDPEATDERYAFLSSLLGIEPQLGQRACVAFNAQPEPVRKAFFAVLIEGQRFNRYVAEGNGSPQEVKGYLRAAFRALGLADEFRRRPPTEGGYDDF